MFCRNILGNVERRVIAAFLATVVSLCATQAMPLRDSRSENIPVVIRLADSRCEKAIERKNASPRITVAHFTPIFTEQFSFVPQVFLDAAAPRAPPV